jgi:hypothetical protein
VVDFGHTIALRRSGVVGCVVPRSRRGVVSRRVRVATRPPREPSTRFVRLLSKRLKELEDRIEILQEQLVAIESRLRLSAHDMCPQCRRGRLRVVDTAPHPEFGFAGIETHQVRCDRAECAYAGTRLYDPNEFLR